MLAVSCAKRTDASYSDVELKSMHAWMGQNVPSFDSLDRGLYIVRVSSDYPDSSIVAPNDWVGIDYTATDMLKGNVFVTRNPDVARVEGTFNIRTHYVPEFVPYTSPNYTMLEALARAIGTMRVGDSVIVYAHSNYTFGSSQSTYDYGFQGAPDHIFPGNVPSIFYLKLKERSADPAAREANMVDKYAADSLGVTVPIDTIAPRQYQYLQKIVEAPDSTQIAEGSTVYVAYTTKFLDGFIADTSVDSVARRAWNTASNLPLGITDLSSTSTSYIKALYNALINMKYGETAVTVFTSDYAYGYAGQTGYPTIQPYEPLVMIIRTMRTAPE